MRYHDDTRLWTYVAVFKICALRWLMVLRALQRLIHNSLTSADSALNNVRRIRVAYLAHIIFLISPKGKMLLNTQLLCNIPSKWTNSLLSSYSQFFMLYHAPLSPPVGSSVTPTMPSYSPFSSPISPNGSTTTPPTAKSSLLLRMSTIAQLRCGRHSLQSPTTNLKTYG